MLPLSRLHSRVRNRVRRPRNTRNTRKKEKKNLFLLFSVYSVYSVVSFRRNRGRMNISHVRRFLDETAQIARQLDHAAIDRIAHGLAELRSRGGRLFLLGVGGSAANCSHAVNDFRKLAGIEAYSPCDNVAELTARTNDEGWATVFEAWLKTSPAGAKDAVLIFSVGGGDVERNVSSNLVR